MSQRSALQGSGRRRARGGAVVGVAVAVAAGAFGCGNSWLSAAAPGTQHRALEDVLRQAEPVLASTLLSGSASSGSPSPALGSASRRDSLGRLGLALGLGLLGPVNSALAATASPLAGKKVVVFGGSGFVGQRICERLVLEGATVASLSRGGGPPPGAGAWASKVSWQQGDVLSADLASLVQGSEAVISAIGAIGSSDDARGNGATNEAAAAAAAKAGVQRFVLISASPDVAKAGLDAVFGGYIEGKRRAEAAVATAFAGNSLVIQPSFIYGGEEFSATPPRVAEWYGEKVEGLLGTGLFRGLAAVSPGALRLALSPLSSVGDVAAAAVAGASGAAQGMLAGHDAIKAAAQR